MDVINQAVHVLKDGGTILYPTETVWGIGCLSNQPKAIDKIFAIKKRAKNQKFILLLDNDLKLRNYVQEIPEIAWDLIDFSEKQPTIIYPNAKNLPDELISQDGSIAIRIVKNNQITPLLNKVNFPLISTSANVSGAKTPTSLKEVSSEILSKVDFIVDLPDNNGSNRPSSIIKLQINGEIKIIRK